MIVGTEKAHQDVIDLLVDACQTVDIIQNPDGSYSKQLILDPEKAWWKTQLVNSPTFGMFTKVLRNLEGMAEDAKNNMSAPRAQVLAEQLLRYCLDYRYSIDAKSSETLRDKNNTQPSLIDKMQRSNTPHAFNPNDEMKKSLFSGWTGGNKSDDEE